MKTTITLLAIALAACSHGDAEKHYQKALAQHDNGNHAAAIESLQKAARENHLEATLLLGICYSTGKGVPQNHARALDYFHQAAARNNAPAMISIALAYHNGNGVPENKTTALHWYKKALAINTLPPGQRDDLQQIIDYLDHPRTPSETYREAMQAFDNEDHDTGLAHLATAARQGYAPAAHLLATIKQATNPGDTAQYLHHYRAAALAGHPSAQTELAQHHLRQNNTTEAARWLERAVKSGNLPDNEQTAAEQTLRQIDPSRLPPPAARQHFDKSTEIVGTDETAAAKHLLQAVALGHAKARVALAMYYHRGIGLPVDHRKTVELLQQAAEQGNVHSWLLLGHLHGYGEIIPQNDHLSLSWLEKASQSGVLSKELQDQTDELIQKLKEYMQSNP